MYLEGIARQQWRARIETAARARPARRPDASPASNGGRGLKLVELVGVQHLQAASPASNGGRGLKLRHQPPPGRVRRIARQQWRARIETVHCWAVIAATSASPASNGGRGLKRA